LAFGGAAASAILHAPKRLIVPRSMIWPSWAADLPKPGEQIDKQRPICTLLARAGTRGRAKRLVETRKASLLAKLENSQGEQCEQEEDRRKSSGTDEKAEREHPSRTAGARHHR
jgi:predicted ATP-grasp superfamily ATP-dependent carboligase